MYRSIVERKQVKDLNQGDILFQNVGKLARGGYLADDKIRQTLTQHNVLFISTLKFLGEPDLSVEDIKNYLVERDNLYCTELDEIREEIFLMLQEVFVPFCETDAIFDNKKRKRQIVAKALFDPQIKELYQADVDSGSSALFPSHKVIALQGKLTEAYRYFNGFKRKTGETKGQNKVFPRQNYSSVRLHTAYHTGLSRVESLGNDILWHAIDTAFYFMATLTNINKIRNAAGKPLSALKYLIDGNVNVDQEFCYRSDIIINATLGALSAPLGFMHTAYLPLISQRLAFSEHEPIAEGTVNLLKKASLVGFNLIRNRDDISAITKLIVRKQSTYQDGTGENYLKDGSPLHEFVRLYQVINAYDTLTHPFLAEAPLSRQDAIDYLLRESTPYDPLEEGKSGHRYDRKMLTEFFSILAPYELSEVVYLVDKEDSHSLYYRGFVVNYNNDSTTPLVSLLYDYKNQKEFSPDELILDLNNRKIFVLKDGKLQKQLVSEKLGSLKIFDVGLSPILLTDYKDPLL